jgi:hypothetical protein
MYQRLMISTLQIDIRLILNAVVDHGIEPIAFTGWRNCTGHAVIEQFLDLVLGRQIDIRAELSPEIP